MNTIHVVILFVVLCNARAESGSGAISESGEGDGDYATDDDGKTLMEEEVQKEPLQSGDSASLLDVDMEGLSSSGMGSSLTAKTFSYNKKQRRDPPSTESTFSSWAKKIDKSQSMHMEKQNNFPTVTITEKQARLFHPTTHHRLDLKDSKKKIKWKDNYLKKIRINLETFPHEHLSKANNRSKHKHNKGRYEYRRRPSSNATKDSHMEFAHVNNVIDEMEKLKKSKSDEELAKKIRKGTESLGVSFKTFEKLSGLWISILHRIWRVWKAKGARQVMSSIAKKIVTKTTQTLTPHFRHFFQNSPKKDNEKETVSISFLPKKNKTRENVSLQNNAQVNQTKQGAKKTLNHDFKTLKRKTKERGKTVKQGDFKNGVNVSVNGIQFISMKNDKTNAKVGTQSNISKQGTVMRNVKKDDRQNHTNQNKHEDKGLHVIGRQRSNVTQSHTVGVKVPLKAPLKVKDKRLTSIKKYKFMNKRTELITTPTDDSAYKPLQYVQGAVFKNSDQVNKLQDKVNRLESEVTVLQTAVSSLVHRINDIERSFQEVSNVTQSEVIYGSTLASTTTSPTRSIGSTKPTFVFPTNHPSFPRKYDDGLIVLPTQQPTPTSKSTNKQFLSTEKSRESTLEASRQLVGMVRPTIKPSSFIRQLQIEELPSKEHLTSFESSHFPVPLPFIQKLQMQELSAKEHSISSKLPAFPAPTSLVQQPQMEELPTKQQSTSTKASAFPEQFYMKVLPDPTAAGNVHKQPLPGDKLNRRHNLRQIIVPLETLYKMQAQEGIRVPDTTYGDSRDFDEVPSTMSPHSNTIFRDKTTKFHAPVNQPQQLSGMAMEQDNHSSEPPIRPIVNIIVPNSRTASIIEKEMCWIPCKNGGKCNGRNTCQCSFPFNGNQCEHFSLYDFINDKANKVSVGSVRRNSMPHQKLQQLSLKDLMQLGAKIRLTNADQVFRSAKNSLSKRERKLPVPGKQFILETQGY